MIDDKKEYDILVVDDNNANLELFYNLLTKNGYKVRLSPNASLAMQAIKTTTPDLILLDIMMPGMNGFEFCRQLKQDEELKDIPVLFISALDKIQEKVEAFKAGALDYITKPFQAEEILARIKTHLDLRTYQLKINETLTDLNIKTAQLEKEQQRFQNIVHCSGDWIWEVDISGKYTYSSPIVENVLGHKPEEMLDKYFYDFFHPDEKEKLKNEVFKIFENKMIFRNFENRNIKKDGTEVIFETSGVPITNDDGGEIIGFRGVDHDVTERKKLEKEKELIYHKLMDISHQSGMAEVATGVLHNVGNILNSVNISADTLIEKINNLTSQKFIEICSLLKNHLNNLQDYLTNDNKGKLIPEILIYFEQRQEEEHSELVQEIKYLKRNIEDMKNIISTQQSLASAKGVKEQVSLDNLVDQAVQVNSADLIKHGVEVTKKYQNDILINTERLKLLQILINLISNARSALENFDKKEIHITLKKIKENYVQIEVIDNGVGIDPKNLIKIFNYGYTTKTDGNGFGLHNSILAAKALGGELVAQSEGTNKGAKFTLIIPANA